MVGAQVMQQSQTVPVGSGGQSFCQYLELMVCMIHQSWRLYASRWRWTFIHKDSSIRCHKLWKTLLFSLVYRFSNQLSKIIKST